MGKLLQAVARRRTSPSATECAAGGLPAERLDGVLHNDLVRVDASGMAQRTLLRVQPELTRLASATFLAARRARRRARRCCRCRSCWPTTPTSCASSTISSRRCSRRRSRSTWSPATGPSFSSCAPPPMPPSRCWSPGGRGQGRFRARLGGCDETMPVLRRGHPGRGSSSAATAAACWKAAAVAAPGIACGAAR